MRRSRTGILIAPALLVLGGCGEKVTRSESIPFSHGEVELTISSVGGALGEERYELEFRNGSKTQSFFRGSNFSEFNAAQTGNKFGIQLCKGSIDHAEPIGVGEGENFKVVRLSLDWNCADKSREA